MHARSASAFLALSAIGTLTSCGGAGGSNSKYSYQNVTITISPRPASVPVGASVTFSSTTANAPNSPLWILLSSAYADLGTLAAGSGDTIVYTAPAAPPVYTGAGDSNVPGVVTLSAETANSRTNFTLASDSISFVITAPTITVGIAPATASVALGATQLFNIYSVGSVDNALTAQVNGVPNGSPATGTLTHVGDPLAALYTYTAPSIMPMSGSTVTLTAISQADPTRSASAVVTLTWP